MFGTLAVPPARDIIRMISHNKVIIVPHNRFPDSHLMIINSYKLLQGFGFYPRQIWSLSCGEQGVWPHCPVTNVSDWFVVLVVFKFYFSVIFLYCGINCGVALSEKKIINLKYNFTNLPSTTNWRSSGQKAYLTEIRGVFMRIDEWFICKW